MAACNFQKARAHREHYLALLAEDEFRKGRGETVERASGGLRRVRRGAQSARPADGAAHEGRGRAGGYH
ncbi:hypothetical protein P4110_29860 [Pseudomonas aeruginosa]|nr:hypothetical protein [Pseudomonas aeruginosa]